MDFTVVFSSVLVIIFLLIYMVRKHYSWWKDMGVPCEEPHFFYGNLQEVGKTETVISVLQKFYRKYKTATSPFIGLYVFFKPAALVTDLELIKTIMIKDFNKFHDRGIYFNERDDPLSAHMFNIYGSKWRSLRMKSTPTFTSGKMKLMFPMVVAVSKCLEDKISEICEIGKEIDIKQLMSRFTTDVIGTVAFGIECNSMKEQDNEFHRMGYRIFDEQKFSFPVQLLLVSFRKVAKWLRIRRYHDDVSDFFLKVIRSTVDYRIANKIRRNDFMDMLIEMHLCSGENHLTFNELAAQAFIFFAAGFETSSSLLQFTLFLLAQNPDIQKRTRDHIEEVLDRYDGQFTYEAMMDMKYVDQVLNEVLRLYPPLATLFREADQDYQVPGTKYLFKKGTLVIISPYCIQNDEKYYPNPTKFDPDNFSEEKIKLRSTAMHLPFGEGPRNCIGARFGMMQARIGLVAALRRYEYELSPKLKLPLEISSRNLITTIVGGVWLKVKEIK